MAAGLLATTANATITIDTNNSASGSLGTVKLNDAGGPAPVLFGTISGLKFQFTGAEDLIAPSQGQARIEADDEVFTVLDMRFELGNLFDRLVFNVDALDKGTLTVNAYDQFGTLFTEEIDLKKGGQNFINIDSDDLQQIASVNFVSSVGLASIAQVRVGGLDGGVNPVPEPGSMALMAAGIAAVVGRRFFHK